MEIRNDLTEILENFDLIWKKLERLIHLKQFRLLSIEYLIVFSAPSFWQDIIFDTFKFDNTKKRHVREMYF